MKHVDGVATRPQQGLQKFAERRVVIDNRQAGRHAGETFIFSDSRLAD
jgi:hypothetical protein